MRKLLNDDHPCGNPQPSEVETHELFGEAADDSKYTFSEAAPRPLFAPSSLSQYSHIHTVKIEWLK